MEEVDRLQEIPSLLECRPMVSRPLEAALVGEIRAHSEADRQRDRQLDENIKRMGVLAWAEMDGDGSEATRLGIRAELAAAQAQTSLLMAEHCDSMAATRRVEAKLWQQGVRLLSHGEHTTRYRAARFLDPDFSALRNAYSQLASRYRLKRGVELEMAGICWQGQAIAGRVGKVKGEHERIMAQEGLWVRL